MVARPAASSGTKAGTPTTNSTPMIGPASRVAPPTTTITATSMLADAGNDATDTDAKVCAYSAPPTPATRPDTTKPCIFR